MKYQREYFIGAVVPAVSVGIIGTIISTLLFGKSGFIAGIFAVTLVFFFLIIHLLVAFLAPKISPIGTMALAMASYFGKVAGVILGLVLLKPISMDRVAFGVIAISSTIAWLVGEMRAYSTGWRTARVPIHEELE